MEVVGMIERLVDYVILECCYISSRDVYHIKWFFACCQIQFLQTSS